MISVEEARARILAALSPVGAEQLPLTEALGRVLSAPLAARRTQPPKPVSAMDGYAVRAEDCRSAPVRLDIVAEIPAGTSHETALETGQAARIFTGAPLPPGTDTIVIQEDTAREGDHVTIREAPSRTGQFVRAAGLDFREGDVLLQPGRRLGVRDVALAAAMNHPWIMARWRPRVAVLATGDEVVMPGEPVGPNQIVSSNALGLAAALGVFGAEPVLLGVARDDRESLRAMAAGAAGADLLVTTGGASVGDHDLVASVLGEAGLEIDFWRIAMRPGKPLMFGRMGPVPTLGLPGNPVSTFVCALLFLAPAVARLSGLDETGPVLTTARLGRDLPENDGREDYLRASLARAAEGAWIATPADRQDSSMMATLQQADCLIRRAVRAPALKAGATVDILPFPVGTTGF